MKVILFGASGMIGQGVLLECLDAADVSRVLVVGRSACGITHAKLEELLHADFLDYSAIGRSFDGYDACFFCLGVSSAGMSEPEYTRVTYDFAVAAAEAIVRNSPGLVFCFLSGQGTDSTEKGSSMWARVKGRTENRLKAMPFRASYMFRPGVVRPLRGIKSRTRLYRAAYVVMAPVFPVLQHFFPRSITTTARIGKAMLQTVRQGSPETILENPAINALAGA